MMGSDYPQREQKDLRAGGMKTVLPTQVASALE